MSRTYYKFLLAVFIAYSTFITALFYMQGALIERLQQQIPPASPTSTTRGVERVATTNAVAGGAGDSPSQSRSRKTSRRFVEQFSEASEPHSIAIPGKSDDAVGYLRTGEKETPRECEAQILVWDLCA